MSKFKFDGVLKIASSMDYNSYVLLDKNGNHIGDLTIADNSILDGIGKLFLEESLAKGDIRPNEKQVKGGMTIGLKIDFISRI